MTKISTDVLRVLVAEDQAIIGLMLAEGLEDAGFHVVGPYRSCAHALGSLDSERPDLAIVDFGLADGPGHELFERLHTRGIPFVIYSGNRRQESLCRRAGDPPWVEKPSPFQTLLDTLNTIAAKCYRSSGGGPMLLASASGE